MLKRIVLGVLWCVVFYFGACMITGAVAGAIAGGSDPNNAAEAGAQAGFQAVTALRGYYAIGAVVLSGLGTWAGVLPGTHIAQSPSPPD